MVIGYPSLGFRINDSLDHMAIPILLAAVLQSSHLVPDDAGYIMSAYNLGLDQLMSVAVIP